MNDKTARDIVLGIRGVFIFAQNVCCLIMLIMATIAVSFATVGLIHAIKRWVFQF